MGRGKEGEETVSLFSIIRKVIAQLAFYRLPVISEWSLTSAWIGERKSHDNFCSFRQGSMHDRCNLPS